MTHPALRDLAINYRSAHNLSAGLQLARLHLRSIAAAHLSVRRHYHFRGSVQTVGLHTQLAMKMVPYYAYDRTHTQRAEYTLD